MVYVEDGRNIPTAVGPSNIPPARSWGILRNIANLPSVANIAGHDRSFLPQLTGTRIAALLQARPLIRLRGSWTRDRQTLSGSDRFTAGGVETHIPEPWAGTPWLWPPTGEVATLPAVLSILSGPGKAMHPQRRTIRRDLCIEL